MGSGASPLAVLFDEVTGRNSAVDVAQDIEGTLSGRKAREGEKERKKQEQQVTDKQNALLKEREDRTKKEESDAKKRKRVSGARSRQRSRSASSRGRRSTFLTGPGGLTDEGSGTKKTLLGS